MVVIPEQPEKAFFFIVVILFEIDKEVADEQFLKASLLIETIEYILLEYSTVSGMEMVVIEVETGPVTSTITFHQTIKNKKSGVILITADVIVVAVNTNTAKLIKMDKDLYNAFLNSME